MLRSSDAKIICFNCKRPGNHWMGRKDRRPTGYYTCRYPLRERIIK